jgi:uncharacterized membrane protein
MQNTNQVQNGAENLPSDSNVVPNENSNTPQPSQAPTAGVQDGTVNPQQQTVNPVNAAVPAQNIAVEQQQPMVTQTEKMYGLLSYLPFVHFVTLILKPESAFVRLHARQGLLLFLLFFFSGIIAALFSSFGLIGAILAFFIAFIPLAITILAVYSMYLALVGTWWKIPVLGAISEIIPIELFAKIAKETVTDQVIQAKENYENRQEAQNDQQPPSSTPTNPPNTTSSNS